jgi:hypothetical protein
LAKTIHLVHLWYNKIYVTSAEEINVLSTNRIYVISTDEIIVMKIDVSTDCGHDVTSTQKVSAASAYQSMKARNEHLPKSETSTY